MVRSRWLIGGLFAAFALASCASRTTLAHNDNVIEATSIPVVSANSLLPDSQWSYSAGPAETPPSAVSAGQALQAAEAEVHGELLVSNTNAVAALVYVTNGTGVTDSGSAVKNRLAWIIQVTGVPIAHSLPMKTQSPVTTTSTVQWVIDAYTGQYLEARDF